MLMSPSLWMHSSLSEDLKRENRLKRIYLKTVQLWSKSVKKTSHLIFRKGKNRNKQQGEKKGCNRKTRTNLAHVRAV